MTKVVPMRIGVTGATGFIGQNLITVLLDRGHQVVAMSRDASKARNFQWFPQVEYVSGDIRETDAKIISLLAGCDCVVHLAWPGLPNYSELFHIETNYPEAYRFLKRLIEGGLKKLTVAGTCFEYGLKNGCLAEDTPAEPVNPYGIAKDILRRSLVCLSAKENYKLQWLRLFYLFGPGQPTTSLISQLDTAVLCSETTFKMSAGEQLRDYLSIFEACKKLAILVEQSEATGIYNICSGVPVSVRGLVEYRLRHLGASIKLDLGHYPYSPFEPHAFWGDPQKASRTISDQ